MGPPDRQRRHSPAITRHIPFPQVLGWDFAGTVASVGANVTHFAEGDPVLGYSPQLFTGVGAFAEQVAAAANLVAPRPAKLSPSQAATVPVCGLTAPKAHRHGRPSERRAGVDPRCGGSRGRFCRTARPGCERSRLGKRQAPPILDVLRARGIQAIDRKTDLGTLDEEPFDLVIDLVGAQASQAAIPLVRANGRLISAVPDNVPQRNEGRRRDFRHRCPTQPYRCNTSLRGSDPRPPCRCRGLAPKWPSTKPQAPSSPSRAESSAARSCSSPDVSGLRMGWLMACASQPPANGRLVAPAVQHLATRRSAMNFRNSTTIDASPRHPLGDPGDGLQQHRRLDDRSVAFGAGPGRSRG